MSFVGLGVAAVHTVTVLTAEDLQVKALAVHFQAFRFPAIAPHFLNLMDFLCFFLVPGSRLQADGCAGHSILGNGSFVLQGQGQLDIHFLAELLGNEGKPVEGAIVEVKIIILGGKGAVSGGHFVVVTFRSHQVVVVQQAPPAGRLVVIAVLFDYFVFAH